MLVSDKIRLWIEEQDREVGQSIRTLDGGKPVKATLVSRGVWKFEKDVWVS